MVQPATPSGSPHLIPHLIEPSEVEPRWNQDGPKVEPRWNQGGTKRGPFLRTTINQTKCGLGSLECLKAIQSHSMLGCLYILSVTDHVESTI